MVMPPLILPETATTLIRRGVTGVVDRFASSIGISVTVGGLGWVMSLLLREGWKGFPPLAEAFGWIA